MLVKGLALAGRLAGSAVAAGFIYLTPEKVTHLAFDPLRQRSGLTPKEVALPGGPALCLSGRRSR
jgi:hypothetical protein